MVTTATLPEPVTPEHGWLGSLSLGFRSGPGRTILERRHHVGPFVVQSPFYPEGEPCHAVLLHPPGGLVGGDRLELDLECEAGSHALVTTPAAGKIYRSAGPETRIRQQLRVKPGAKLEFLPTESIVFDGARCTTDTHFHVQAGASLLAWDAWVLGRPASGDGFSKGRIRQAIEVTLDGRPLLVERNHIVGGDAWLDAAWGLHQRPAFATLVACPGDEYALEQVRNATATPDCEAAVTLVDGLLVARVMAFGLITLRAQIEHWWQVLRPIVMGRTAIPPRIWAT